PSIIAAASPAAGAAPPPPPQMAPIRRRRAPDATTLTMPVSPQQPPQQRPQPARPRVPLPDGFVVARYKINTPIGEGGFAITYRAADMTLDRQIVIKELFLPEHCERDPTLAIRARADRNSEKAFQWAGYYFSQEAKITADLRHESIVRLTDF